jgi:hypothetical protein
MAGMAIERKGGRKEGILKGREDGDKFHSDVETLPQKASY